MPAFRPVDAQKLTAALETAGDTAAGRILRLAAGAGLTRAEIQSLIWGQVDFSAWHIVLPERTVPMDAELVTYLLPLREEDAVPVVRAQRERQPLTAQTISHMARAALCRAGLEDVRPTDLRGEFARSLVRSGQDWQAVSRMTGLDGAALRTLGQPTRTRRAAAPSVSAEALQCPLSSVSPLSTR